MRNGAQMPLAFFFRGAAGRCKDGGRVGKRCRSANTGA